MYPELFTLPGGFTIKTYGFCLMVGFLSAVWLAMRRAIRMKVDPDRVLDISFLCLLFGVGGARLFYVIHYWTPQFADAPNRFLAIIDITEGGLEFLGGFLGALGALIVWGVVRKQSLRLFLDIMAPGAMWGLAFGRLGCFFNGCCFGGVCPPPTDQAQLSWAVRFPFASPAHWREWEDRQVTAPAELITTLPVALTSTLVPDTMLNTPVEKLRGHTRKVEDLTAAYEKAKQESPQSPETEKLKTALEAATKYAGERDRELLPIRMAQRFPSRAAPNRATSVSELQELADQFRSLPIHPTQIYASIHALVLSIFLSSLAYVRKRHGVVIGALLVLYPLQRMLEEMIRVDNPHDVAGLTVSQFVSLTLCAIGLIYLYILYKHMPERSPHAQRAAMPAES